MGYAVLHLDKAKGNEARTSSHIERTVEPKNADKNRTHLNREFIEFPEGVRGRTQAIQHRIKTAGIKRKVTGDQVRVIRINLSGSPEDMKRIEKEGRLNHWCSDSLEWLKETFGDKNVVSAVLHMDEKTPHIHASVVPIVTGQRRKAKENSKKKNAPRLCADDVMTRSKMVEYQDSYAEKMQKYGLERGIRGSEARHVTTGEYYRNIFEHAETIKEEVSLLQQQKTEEEQAVKELQHKERQEQQRLTALQMEADRKQKEVEEKQRLVQKAKNEISVLGVESSLKKTAKNVSEGIGALMGNPKAKKLQEEVNILKQKIETLQTEKETIGKESQKSIIQKDRLIFEKDSIINTQQTKLDKLFDGIPILKDYDFIIRLCEHIGLAFDSIKQILKGKEISYTGKLYSPEHKQSFETTGTKIRIAKDPDNSNKLCLAIGELDYANWFREQKKKLLENMGINIPQPKNRQGFSR